MQNRKLHICIITGQFPALTETFITTKVLELHKRGHKITVITNQQNEAINASHLKLVKDAGIEVVSFVEISSASNLIKAAVKKPASVLKAFSLNIKKFKQNYKANVQGSMLQKHSFDIVHFEFSGLAVSYLEAIKNLDTNLIVSCRGTAEKVKTISQPDRAQKLTSLFSNIKAIHCVSSDMAKTIQSFCSNLQKVFINRPSIDAEVFKRSTPYPDANTEIRILSIGRFTFQKGYLLGLLAIRELKNKGQRFCWKIVGDGPQWEEILYYVHSLQLTDCVELLGKKNRDEVLELYNRVDIFFLPSVYEGIANVCLEAMSMELPVVATKSGGMEEVIEHAQDGLLAETYDSKSMAEQLFAAVSHFEKRKQMGVNARQKVLQQFTLQRQVDVFEQEYYKLVNTTQA